MITMKQLVDALVLANVIYMDGPGPELFNGFQDSVDLTPHLEQAVEYLNAVTNGPKEGT